MFPYIVTFQNKLKGVIIQYIRKILGVIFLQFINPFLYFFLHSLAFEIFIVVKISRITFLPERPDFCRMASDIAINAPFFSYKS